MYSWEIDNILKDYNYNIPASVYIEVTDINKNPQVGHVEYSPWSDSFIVWTNDGYNWSFKVYREDN